MSYTRPQRTSLVGRWRGPGRAMPMGDVTDPVADLTAQVNRFGPSAPPAYRMLEQTLPVASGKVDMDLATAALLIYQRRATDAYNQFHDAGSEAAIGRANAGFADPVGFVSSHLADVTQVVGAFADSLGIPAAASGGGVTSAGGFDTRTLLLAAGGLAVLWLVMR